MVMNFCLFSNVNNNMELRKVKLVTLKPTVLVSQFDATDLQPVAKEVEETLIAIMKEAAS
jgi:hypothetical protein